VLLIAVLLLAGFVLLLTGLVLLAGFVLLAGLVVPDDPVASMQIGVMSLPWKVVESQGTSYQPGWISLIVATKQFSAFPPSGCLVPPLFPSYQGIMPVDSDVSDTGLYQMFSRMESVGPNQKVSTPVISSRSSSLFFSSAICSSVSISTR